MAVLPPFLHSTGDQRVCCFFPNHFRALLLMRWAARHSSDNLLVYPVSPKGTLSSLSQEHPVETLERSLGVGKTPCVWVGEGAPVTVDWYTGIYIIYIIFETSSPPLYESTSSSRPLSKAKQFRHPDSPGVGGSFSPLWNSVSSLPCGLSSRIRSGKLGFCTSFSIFVLRWEWHSPAACCSPGKSGIPRIIGRSSTFHFTNTLVCGVSYAAAQINKYINKARSQSRKHQVDAFRPMPATELTALFFCWPERISLFFL